MYLAFPIQTLKNFSNAPIIARALALANLRVNMESIIECMELSYPNFWGFIYKNIHLKIQIQGAQILFEM